MKYVIFVLVEIMIKYEGYIKKQIEDLSELDPGSEEKSKAIDNVVKLYKLTVEKEKASCDSENESRNL